MLSLYTVGICYFCFDNLLCIMNLHTAAQFRILQHRLVKIDHEQELENNDTSDSYSINRLQFVYNKLKKCIVQHQMLINYCEDLNHVFTFIILGQVLLFSILICLVGYEILIVSTNLMKIIRLLIPYYLKNIYGKFVCTFRQMQLLLDAPVSYFT